MSPEIPSTDTSVSAEKSFLPRGSVSVCVPFCVPVWLVALLAVICLSGCRTSFSEYRENGFKVGPNYRKPAAEVADHWIDYQDTRLSTDAPADWAWWRLFNDPVLDRLVQNAEAQNITLREAGYRVMEARAIRAITAGNLLPQFQTLDGSFSRRQLSLETGLQAGGGGGGIGGISRRFNNWQVGPQFAWELDFWGRFRRAVESADASLDASIEGYDDVLVVLIGDVATAYVNIRTLEQRIAYARSNLASQVGSLDLAEAKLEEGAASKLDVTQAVTNAAQTEATIPAFEAQLRQAENQLCVLLGIPPQDLTELLSDTRGIPNAPAQLAIGIPAELLRRRPDVRQAEREVAAQSALIGVAEADLYPAFTINGTVFVQANQFDRLFRSSAVGGSIGPSFSWNVLNYGRLQSAIDLEEARWLQQVAQYQNVVLNANREAEDAAVAFLRAKEQAEILRRGAEAAEESRDLVNELYRGGRADFGRVFVAELFLVQQQDALALAEGAIAQAVVDLYRALGGGWQMRLEGLPPIDEAGMPAPAAPPAPPVPNVPANPELQPVDAT